MQNYRIYLCKSCRNKVAAEHRLKTGNEYYQHWVARNNARILWHGAKRRAAAAGLPFDITLEDIVIPSTCPALGIPLIRCKGSEGGGDNSPSIDRLIPELGYVRGNIVVISKKANIIKSNATWNEIESVARWLREQLRKTE